MSVNAKLMDEREKAYNLLKNSRKLVPESYLSPLPHRKESQSSVNVSDIKNEKTIYLETTPKKDSPEYFNASEMTARSTMCHAKPKPLFGRNSMFSSDLDQILQTSCVQDVRNLSEIYRESMDNMSNMSLPRTADISRASLGSFSFKNGFNSTINMFSSSSSQPNDNLFDLEEFTPAELAEDQLKQDEMSWDQEYAVIPSNAMDSKSTEDVQSQNFTLDALWSNPESQKNFSMGQFFKNNSDDLRSMIPNQSPKKINRTNRTKGFSEQSFSSNTSLSNKQISFSYDKIRKALEQDSIDSAKKHLSRHLKLTRVADHDNKENEGSKNSNSNMRSIAERDFEIAGCSKQLSELEQFLIDEQITKSYTDSLLDENELSSLNRDFNKINLDRSRDPLRRQENVIELPKNNKRRSSSAAGDYTEPSDTPKSTMERPIKRSRSPNTVKELHAASAASKLRPKASGNRNYPQSADKLRQQSNDSSGFKSASSSSQSSHYDNREYFNKQSLEVPQIDSFGKLSLPNYSLKRQDYLPSSPTASVKSSASTFASPLKRTESQCSTQSEFNDNFMPLHITHKKLSWETVKLRKTLSKSLNIQNSSVKKLTLRVSVEGPGFQLDSSEIKMGLVLFRSEVRSISVQFCPTVVGPACGSLIFEAVNGVTKKVPLYAFGGHALLKVDHIQRGPFGPPFLTMGTVADLGKPLIQSINLSNTGSLPGFATIAVEKSDLMFASSTSIEPNIVYIEPGRSVEVMIKFRPNREAVKNIVKRKMDVTTIGEICVIFSDEATRLRVLKFSHMLDKKILKVLPEHMPNEQGIIRRLADFDEDLNAGKLSSIMSQIKTIEFALTINRLLDDTQFSCDFSLNDESTLAFETFYEPGNIIHQQQNRQENASQTLQIHPQEIRFYRQIDSCAVSKTLTLRSMDQQRKTYVDISCDKADMLNIYPSSAEILPGHTIEVQIFPCYMPQSAEISQLQIFVENERFVVPVKFLT